MRLVRTITIALSIFLSFAVLASDYECSGLFMKCSEGEEIHHLTRLSESECSGSYEGCRQYLKNELKNLRKVKKTEVFCYFDEYRNEAICL